jgi:Spy/CpxP family protein refolding chaperone
MVDKLKNRILNRGGAALAFMLSLAVATASAAQQTAPANPQNPPAGSSTSSQPQGNQGAKSATHITPEQAQQLFALVDELQKFASQETGLPIKSTVKRQMTTRAAVEAYLEKKFNEDESAKRLQRDEIVLKKFGLLDRDFELKPFLLALLKEQIEAYYDSKTKTVNLLDWVDPDEQKPVMAHELTHASAGPALRSREMGRPDSRRRFHWMLPGDEDHLAKDEIDTARDAVAEGTGHGCDVGLHSQTDRQESDQGS